MIPQGRQGPQAVDNHNNGGQTGRQNTEAIHEVIEDIQHVQAGCGGHQQGRDNRQRDNYDHG